MIYRHPLLSICTFFITTYQFCLDIIIIIILIIVSLCYLLIQSLMMETLKSGVLVKFLEDMKLRGNSLPEEGENGKDSMLLQIRSIVPVLEEGDDHLNPSRGFYLKVSDDSHATYVSLGKEENEMILANELKLGQFIYVEKLEECHPFPILRGVTPLPGRHPCDGTPEEIMLGASLVKNLDQTSSSVAFPHLRGVTPIPGRHPCDVTPEKIISGASLAKVPDQASDSGPSPILRGVVTPIPGTPGHSVKNQDQASNSDCVVEKGVISENVIVKIPRRGLRKKKNDGLEGKCTKKKIGSSSAPSKVGKESDIDRRNSVFLGEIRKSRKRRVELESDDADSSLSSISLSSQISKRKSWNESEILGVKGIFDSSVVKHDTRPPPPSTAVSPVRSVTCDSSDDKSSSVPRRRRNEVGGSAKKIKSSTKRQNSSSKIKCDRSLCSINGLINDRQRTESVVSWDSLSSSLVKLGKEVVKKRDVALVAATDALQEACAAERALGSLSKFSEFRLAEQDDLQPHIDRFLDLQDDMSHTRLILQSLTNITSGEANSTTAVQRKKNAYTWIKSAVSSDLSPIHSNTAHSTTRKSRTSNQSTKKPKGAAFVIRSHKTSTDEEQKEWTRGSTIPAVNVLASSLQDECRKMFLVHVEKYLDEVERMMSSSMVMLDSQKVAGMMMYKVKRVNDWLDVITRKDRNLEESEMEACQRVRNKIYGILLKHVERTAMAFGK